jgi:LmbE family N-acetylglucosaminyl deacetylase
MTAWIYLSPHFDDVALSCGGLAWEQAQAGEQVGIWTICAGGAPEGALSPFAESLHARWGAGGEAVQARRLEDIASCELLGTSHRHFPIPDCIYRKVMHNEDEGEAMDFFPYASEESITGPIHPAEQGLVRRLSAELAQALPEEAEVVSPLALGGHVDHRLARATAEGLGRRLWYYADYPYALKAVSQLEALRLAGWEMLTTPVSPQGLRAWQQAIAAHKSQISTFWPDLQAMQAAIEAYRELWGGVALFVQAEGR